MPSRSKSPGWEEEFWHYISLGDGDICPIYQNCEILHRIKCQCPFSAIWERGWLEAPLIPTLRLDKALSMDDIVCQIVKCNQRFIECLRPGRIFEVIEKLADKYLKMGKIAAPPVPSVLIGLFGGARSVEVRPVPLKYYHGAIWCTEDAWVVHLNTNDSPSTQRISLFHEAFHILAHNKSTPVFKKIRSDKGAFNEVLAENFAHCILMPQRWILKAWNDKKAPALMAELFEVPEEAMILRLKSLSLL